MPYLKLYQSKEIIFKKISKNQKIIDRTVFINLFQRRFYSIVHFSSIKKQFTMQIN